MTRRDNLTLELPDVPRKRGRPPVADAMSHADRQAAYRQRQKAKGKVETTIQLQADVFAALHAYVERHNADKADAPITLGDAADKILRDRLLRKR